MFRSFLIYDNSSADFLRIISHNYHVPNQFPIFNKQRIDQVAIATLISIKSIVLSPITFNDFIKNTSIIANFTSNIFYTVSRLINVINYSINFHISL